MKNNQVYLDPKNVEASLRQLNRFYRLDTNTLKQLADIVAQYPKPVIVYVDEVNAPYVLSSPLDDPFTFNTETGELVLFSADAETFINGLIEMWMYVQGFDTQMGSDEYWRVEFSIGAWKPVRDTIKKRFNIPVNHQVELIVGMEPTAEEATLEDPYPFKTLVSSFNLIAFTQMIRLAGRKNVRVHFPDGTHSGLMNLYQEVRRMIEIVSEGVDITDVDLFNRRLKDALTRLERKYQPATLPIPEELKFDEEEDAASGPLPSDQDDDQSEGHILLGPSDDEPAYGRLLSDAFHRDDQADEQTTLDRELADGPFGQFIESLFDD